MSFYVEISENGGLLSTRLVHHFYPVASKPGTIRLTVDSLVDPRATEEFDIYTDYDELKKSFVSGGIPHIHLGGNRR